MSNKILAQLGVIVLFSSCVVIPTYNERFSLRPTTLNYHRVPITNVLLVGTGASPSKIFLQNLSTEMIQSLKGRGIESEFSHAGQVHYPKALNLDSIITQKYDGYLVFEAANTPVLNMTKEKFSVIGAGTVGRVYGNQFSENYTVTMYSVQKHVLWQGNLAIDLDIAGTFKYKEISKRILSELSKGQVLN